MKKEFPFKPNSVIRSRTTGNYFRFLYLKDDYRAYLEVLEVHPTTKSIIAIKYEDSFDVGLVITHCELIRGPTSFTGIWHQLNSL